jgi:hypothetical protein
LGFKFSSAPSQYQLRAKCCLSSYFLAIFWLFVFFCPEDLDRGLIFKQGTTPPPTKMHKNTPDPKIP